MALHFDITQKQYNILSGLRFNMANKAYLLERYPDEYETESKKIHLTICDLFDEADNEKNSFLGSKYCVRFPRRLETYKADLFIPRP